MENWIEQLLIFSSEHSGYRYLTALLIIVAGFTVRWFIVRLAEKARNRHSETGGMAAGLWEATTLPLGWAVIGGSVLIATMSLPLTDMVPQLESIIAKLAKAGITILIVWTGSRFFEILMRNWEKRTVASPSRIDDQLVPILRRSGKTFIYLLGLLLVLQNLGISVSGLLAGFGIGSAAIALASKETLSNVLGSIVIFFDRPFMIGDWIEMDDVEGTVEEIELRTTRIRTFANSQITIPNASFTTKAINNWSRMNKRRIKCTLELAYGANSDQAQAVIQGIRKMIDDSDDFNHDFRLVNLSALGANGWEVFVYCFTNTTDWSQFMQVRESFFLNIWKLLEQEGVKLAYSTQSILVNDERSQSDHQET